MDDFEQRLQLTKWEAHFQKKHFDLLTIRSLIVDNDPRFKQLKQLIANFNSQSHPDRGRYQQPFIQQLFKMLSSLTRLETSEEQFQFLQKIHLWATRGGSQQGNNSTCLSKSRPTTASTRTRPTTAHSRPATAKLTVPKQKESIQMKKTDLKIDYDKLKQGEHQFFSGARTLHPLYEEPKKRLKQYQRVKLAEDDPDSDIQIIEIEEKPILKEIQITQQKMIEDIQEEQQGQEPPEGAEGLQGDANVDDIPLQGEQQPAAEAEEQEKEVVDKLRPKRKVYGEPKGLPINKRHFQGGLNHSEACRQYRDRKVQQDKDIVMFQAQWAQHKGRAKTDSKRRAESAKILGKMVGIPVKKKVQTIAQQNVINFDNVEPAEVKNKATRPVSAFTSDRMKVRQEIIKNQFLTSKLSTHIRPLTGDSSKRENGNLVVVGEKPKRKCFEQILRQAQERVVRQSQEEVFGVKQSLVKGKVSLNVGKIAKSISHHERQLPGQWCGDVAGMGMVKNPFIKVGKKKKKKKKKGK